MKPYMVVVQWKDKSWQVVHDGEPVAVLEKKTDAVEEGRRYARRHCIELVVKNKNGRIAWRNSYGNDRKDRKG